MSYRISAEEQSNTALLNMCSRGKTDFKILECQLSSDIVNIPHELLVRSKTDNTKYFLKNTSWKENQPTVPRDFLRSNRQVKFLILSPISQYGHRPQTKP